jgi:hypothetical protein
MDLFLLILLAILCIVIGFFLSALVSALRGRKGEARLDSVLAEAAASETVRLGRERGKDRLVVELDGRACRSPGELSPAQRERLAAYARDLQSWLGLPAAVPPDAAPPTATAPPSFTPRGAVDAPPAAGPPQAERPSLNPLKPFSRAFGEVDKKPAEAGGPGPGGQSIAAQIDAILQANLQDTDLAGRSIRLMELPGQGMVVMVGLEKFSEVSAIPDARVRAAIRQAVEEWEARQGG